MWCKRGLISLTVLIILALVGVWAWSGPLIPGQVRLPDDVRSLAGLKKIRIEVLPIIPQLKEVGLDPAVLKQTWRTILQEAGYEVVDDHSDPTTATVELTILGGGDKRVPEGMAISSTLTLWQTVRIERMNESLRVPTYTRVMAGLEPRDTFADVAQSVVQTQALRFINDAREATHMSSGEEQP